jgi:CBS domain-containing protein
LGKIILKAIKINIDFGGNCMQVKDVMTKSVASLNPHDTVERAAQQMKEHDIGSLPVCDGEHVIGIVTDRDIALRCVAEGDNIKTATVREIMTSNPVVVSSSTDIQEAARIMSERQIRRLPIVDNNNLVGMVALGDIAVEPKLEKSAESVLSNVSEPASPNI